MMMMMFGGMGVVGVTCEFLSPRSLDSVLEVCSEDSVSSSSSSFEFL
jgi:hypothetical protein